MYIGPYRQLSLIKVGHKTQIWEVVRDSTREKFAIKILRQDPPERQQVQLLQHEFRVGSKLEHPHLVRILQFDMHKGLPYLVMELFHTLNLKQRILQGHERYAYLAERFIDEASEVLQYLHQRGWVHRDIKPDNFLVSPEGEVRLIDLALMQRASRGLARLFSRRSKTIQGTPSYLAPEQIRCQALDTSADVYSLGCTIFEMLTGKTPYTGSTLNDLLNKHLRAPVPSLEAANRNVTQGFSQLVQRMLAKRPQERPSIIDFRREFRAVGVFKNPPKAPDESPAAAGERGE